MALFSEWHPRTLAPSYSHYAPDGDYWLQGVPIEIPSQTPKAVYASSGFCKVRNLWETTDLWTSPAGPSYDYTCWQPFYYDGYLWLIYPKTIVGNNSLILFKINPSTWVGEEKKVLHASGAAHAYGGPHYFRTSEMVYFVYTHGGPSTAYTWTCRVAKYNITTNVLTELCNFTVDYYTQPTGLGVSGTDLYWALRHYDSCKLYKIPTAGGAKTEIISNPMNNYLHVGASGYHVDVHDNKIYDAARANSWTIQTGHAYFLLPSNPPKLIVLSTNSSQDLCKLLIFDGSTLLQESTISFHWPSSIDAFGLAPFWANGSALPESPFIIRARSSFALEARLDSAKEVI